eukprot:14356529-Alexandrium_andersonii.AAC.1
MFGSTPKAFRACSEWPPRAFQRCSGGVFRGGSHGVPKGPSLPRRFRIPRGSSDGAQREFRR